MARHIILLLALGILPLGGMETLQAKPSPPVGLSIQAESPCDPGEPCTLVILLKGGPRAVVGDLTLEIPPGVFLLSPRPEFHGGITPGEVLRFSVRVEGLGPEQKPITATFSPSGSALWKVRAHHQPYRSYGVSKPRFGAKSVSPPVMRPQAAADSLTLTGVFTYRNRAQNADGFVNEILEDDPVSPVRQVKVEILLDAAVVASGETMDSGAFSFRLPESEGMYAARVTSELPSHPLVVQRYPLATVFTAQSAGVDPPPGEDLDFGELLIEAGNGGEAFNVVDATLDGILLLEDLTGAPQKNNVIVRWGHPTSSFYGHGSKTVTLAEDDGYDDSVILHEYGHYVIKDYSKDQSPGGQHFVNDDHQDPYVSWAEGMASFWQAATRLESGDPIPSWYVDTGGLPGAGNLDFSYDCEGPSLPVKGVASETVVQAALWDMIDGSEAPDDHPAVDDDALELPLSEVWEVLTDYIPGALTITLEDFWLGWFSGGIANGFQSEMEVVFGSHGVEILDDLQEPDDSAAQGKPLILDGATVHHTFFEAGDRDYHELNLDADQLVIVETSNLIGWSDTRIEILDPSLTTIAVNDDRLPNVDISSQVSFVAGTAGTYIVIVSKVAKGHSSKLDFGVYDLRALEADVNAYPFTSIAGSAGVDNSGFGVGPSFGDYNGDGFLDLILVNNPADADTDPVSEKDALYRNQGNGVFSNVTQNTGIGRPEGGVASAWGDMDNDGDLDLFLSNHVLYRNEDNAFEDVSLSSGVVDAGSEFDGKWGDADNDGYLDLFVPVRDGASVLWHNNGDGTFVEIAEAAGMDFPLDGGQAYACAWGDYDNDGRRDLFVGFNEAGDGHHLFRNLGNNTFQEVTLLSGLQTEDSAASATWADLNGDGQLDLYVCSSDVNKLFINQGDGTFDDQASQYGVALEDYSRCAGFADYDLDGDLDLYVSNLGTASGLYENVGASMVKINEASGNSNSLGMAWSDIDADGDPDIYVAQARDNNLLWRNNAQQTDPGLHWIKVDLTGVVSNRNGIGARMTVYAGELVQMREVGTGFGWATMSVQPELFGIPDGVVDSVRVDWPSGAYNVEVSPEIDETLIIVEDDSTPVLPGGGPPVVLTVKAPRPNPFRSATALTFSLGRTARVRAEVYDIAGRRVAEVVNQNYPAGTHRLGWDGRARDGAQAAPGVYFYRISAGGVAQTRKVIRLP